MQKEREDSRVWFGLFSGRGMLCRGGTLCRSHSERPLFTKCLLGGI